MHLDDLFDRPFSWRAEAADALRLDGEALCAALSPGAAYPSVLRSMVAALPQTVDLLVDVGAGPGGASEWLRSATGATVIAVEPVAVARYVARSCFPHLHVVDGDGHATGLPSSIADAVSLCGVLSLIQETDRLLDEVERVALPGATLAIADLFSRSECFDSGPNVFRDIVCVIDQLERRGWSIRNIGCGVTDVGAEWSEPAELVDEWILEHCSDRDGFEEWIRDRLHLRRHVVCGDLLAGSVVAVAPA